jgi:hypothetical protein
MYVMMNEIMLSIYPGADMISVVHKYLFEMGKYIHRKIRKTEVEGSSTNTFWIVEQTS